MSSIPAESLLAEKQPPSSKAGSMNRQASSKNALTIQSVAVESRDSNAGADKGDDMTPLQFKLTLLSF